MRHIPEPPVSITGPAYEYLYKLQEILNLTLEERNTVATGEETVKASGGGGVTANVKTTQDSEASDLKALIIKTAQAKADAARAQQTAEQAQQTAENAATAADYELMKQTIIEVNQSLTDLSARLSSEYVAASEFGRYIEQINAEIVANPESITQYYSFYSWLQANLDEVSASFTDYKVNTEGYIRTGIVYYEDNVPVYGVAVGQNLTVKEVDGETVVDQTNFRATYTAAKLSFWQGEYEMGYFSNDGLHTKSITVDGRIDQGPWRIDITNGWSLKWIGG